MTSWFGVCPSSIHSALNEVILIKARYLSFDGHCGVSLTEPTPLSLPDNATDHDQVLVESLYSGISFGTEGKIYAGQWPDDLPLDDALPGMTGAVRYPLRYGYATVGRVLTDRHSASLEGRLVFCFTPHGSHHCVARRDLILLPELRDPRLGVFIPNLETAVGLVMDMAPRMAEAIGVVGLGVVGQLTWSLLRRFPLAELVAIDTDAYRLHLCQQRAALSQPSTVPMRFLKGTRDEGLAEGGSGVGAESLDGVIEVSGAFAGLNTATAITARGGRIVLGSFYGAEQDSPSAPFAASFHRSHIRMISSQVSRIDPALTPRFSKARRMDYVLSLLVDLQDELMPLMTHTVPFTEAPAAYELLANKTSPCAQVILNYQEPS